MIEEIIDFSYYTKVGITLLFPLFFVFLMCMIDLKRTKLFFNVFTSNTYFYTYPTDVTSIFSLYHFSVLGFISSLLAFLLLPFLYTDIKIFDFFLASYSRVLLIATIYLGIKFLLVEFVSNLSNKNKHSKQMLILEISYLASCFLVVYIISFYGFLHLNQYVIWSKVLLISSLVLYLIRLLALFNNNKNLMSGKLLYIILYLCILEITPIVYLFKCYID